MGSEVIAHFQHVDGAIDTRDVAGLTPEEADIVKRDQLVHLGQLVARLSPRTRAAAGQRMTVSLDLERIHLFDPETELAI